MAEEDPILKKLTDIQRTVDELTSKVSMLEKKWQWITAAAMFVVGAVGGPQAVSLVNGGGGG